MRIDGGGVVLTSLDVRNEVCSGVVLKVLMRLKKMQPGDVLEVFLDRSSQDDVMRIFAKRLGHEILDVHAQSKYVTIHIRKREGTTYPG